jgi:twitching motility protein PilT
VGDIEDPIEYVFPHKQSVVVQRELGKGMLDFASAFRAARREDPDVILVGELRDLQTIEAALIAAETGHPVLATLHTHSATQSVDRIVDVFPPHQHRGVITEDDALEHAFDAREMARVLGRRQL